MLLPPERAQGREGEELQPGQTNNRGQEGSSKHRAGAAAAQETQQEERAKELHTYGRFKGPALMTGQNVITTPLIQRPCLQLATQITLPDSGMLAHFSCCLTSIKQKRTSKIFYL